MDMSGLTKKGRRIAGAAELAVQQVNADKTLLPGHTLDYLWGDSGCSPKQALVAMGELLHDKTHVSAVIGPGCSSACKVTSYLGAGQVSCLLLFPALMMPTTNLFLLTCRTYHRSAGVARGVQ